LTAERDTDTVKALGSTGLFGQTDLIIIWFNVKPSLGRLLLLWKVTQMGFFEQYR